MSAPSVTMRCACAIATAGSMNCPPSENESGVTLRTPMTSGRPGARSRRSMSERSAAAEVVAIIALACAAATMFVKARWAVPPRVPSIRDLQRQLLGVLDPARDRLLGGQKVDQFALGIG